MTSEPPFTQDDLLPGERIALRVALAQISRGDVPRPNIATLCVYVLARITGLYDYTKAEEPVMDAAP